MSTDKEKTVENISDLARLAGVSKSTASRALNNNPRISDKVRKKIQKIARDKGFVVHHGARSLSLGMTNSIGLIIPDGKGSRQIMSDPFFAEMLKGINSAASVHNYDLLIIQPDGKSPRQIINYIKSKRVDALIVVGCPDFTLPIFSCADSDAPIVYWGEHFPGFCSVDCDNYSGGFIAAEYLLSAKRKKIVFLGGNEELPEIKKRYDGYCAAHEKYSFKPDKRLSLFGDFSAESGYDNMKKILTQHSDIDAVFACSDTIAFGAVKCLSDMKYDVPGDVLVIGFDDISISAHSVPPLSTIRQDIALSGKSMVDSIIDFLKTGTVTHKIIPVSLVLRSSA
ncbi:MAG: LacI family DNA-binding transcriptional regulator [Spirochaetes bacterium]|nr:LacI family DNA-binding transcriptional regulator [Spirochaetota bacterium]